MKINSKEFIANEKKFLIRSAIEKDAKELSALRLQLDGETENFDRERGEAFLDTMDFSNLIQADSIAPKNLLLVAEMNEKIVGYSRCEGSPLKRLAHRVEFGVGVLQEYWGYGIGKHLLHTSLEWATSSGVKKMTLQVLETNRPAIYLYEKSGFEIEGILKKDKLLSDGNYYNTIVMGKPLD